MACHETLGDDGKYRVKEILQPSRGPFYLYCLILLACRVESNPNMAAASSIEIPVTIGRSGSFNGKFTISVSRNANIKSIIREIEKQLYVKHYPSHALVYGIDAEKSFIKQSVIVHQEDYKDLCLLSISDYSKSAITNKGLFVEVEQSDDIGNYKGSLELSNQPDTSAEFLNDISQIPIKNQFKIRVAVDFGTDGIGMFVSQMTPKVLQ